MHIFSGQSPCAYTDLSLWKEMWKENVHVAGYFKMASNLVNVFEKCDCSSESVPCSGRLHLSWYNDLSWKGRAPTLCQVIASPWPALLYELTCTQTCIHKTDSFLNFHPPSTVISLGHHGDCPSSTLNLVTQHSGATHSWKLSMGKYVQQLKVTH